MVSDHVTTESHPVVSFIHNSTLYFGWGADMMQSNMSITYKYKFDCTKTPSFLSKVEDVPPNLILEKVSRMGCPYIRSNGNTDKFLIINHL